MNTLGRRLAAALVALATAFTGLAMVAPASSAASGDQTTPVVSDADTVSADVLAAPQINGVVWRQVIAGSTVYAVGQFTTARPAGSAAGQNEVVRTNILAYDINTGALLPFAPDVNNQVVDAAVSPDGKTLYIAGLFTSINGQSRYRAAAFDISSGSLKSWRPVLNARATSITATNSSVYIGGVFTTVNNQTRTRVVGVDTTTGTTDTPLNATIPDGDVRGVQVSPDGTKVVIAGSFTSVNGSDRPGYGLARLDASSGESLSFPVNDLIRNATDNAAIYSLKSDASGVYGTGYDFYGPSEFEGGFHTDWEGNLIWLDGCKGDTYDIWPDGNVVYEASHKHDCSALGDHPQTDPWTFHHASAVTNFVTGTNLTGAFTGQPAPTVYAFRPEFQTGTFTAAKQAVWGVTGNSDYIIYGGEFTKVNNVAQQGIVRFARRSAAPNAQGPRYGGASINPAVAAVPNVGLRITVPGDYDRDDYKLRYTVYRNDTNTVIYDAVRDSRWYDLTPFALVDTGATPGDTVRYRVRVTDPSGNTVLSEWVSAVAPTPAPLSTLAAKMLADDPVHYWRLNEPSGTTSYDWAGPADLTLRGATLGATGLDGTPSATRFSGSSSSYGSTSSREVGKNTFSLEVWFNTTQSGGGKILAFGNSSTGNSSSYDRHLYLDSQNRLAFGVYPGQTRVLQSTSSVADGEWHQAVGTLDSTGMRLYLDGKLIGVRTDTTSAQSYNGYWRIGGDSAWSGNNYFKGLVSDAAVYGTALTADQVARHFNAGIPQPPVADYAISTHGLAASFDASASSVIDGSIVGYAWDFGDGSSGSGAAVSHEYAAAGTYQVTLTVTDDRGATATVTKSVEVAEIPNAAPVASFTVGATGLGVVLDGSGSSDSDGSVVGYAWDFGDGSSGSGVSVSHDYAAAGTYQVTLTVTDDRGATGSVTRFIDVAEVPNEAPVAEFGSVADGLSVSLDGSGSSDSDGSVVGYAWDFGDGSSGSGVSVSHEYAAAGTYQVTLTVTDDRGATGSVTKAITVAEIPNAAPVASFTVGATGLGVVLDGSGSSDSDGSVVGYAWDFGDGGSGSGAAASHDYAVAGTYQVTLTVTDDRGATGTSVQAVTVAEAPVVVPHADFTATPTGLRTAFDGSASSVSGGDIVGYAWDFGDGSSGSGVSVSHGYAAAGTYQVTLTVTDDRGATGSVTKAITVAEVPNVAPVASFGSVVDGLSVSLDGSGSSDSDGSVVGYAWDFGDGGSGSGAAVSHEYAAAGTYEVTLTVTDDRGATGSATRSVTVVAVPDAGVVLARDVFDRSVSGGWGSAQVGGAWTVGAGAASRYGVAGGVGRQTLAGPGQTTRMNLLGVSSDSTDLRFSVGVDKTPTASLFVHGIVRRVGTAEYASRVTFQPSGGVALNILCNGSPVVGGVVSGLTVVPGERLNVAVQAEGVSPTVVRVKVWKDGTAEPAAWAYSLTDSTAGLQSAGAIAFESYLGGSASNAPIDVSFSNVWAGPVGTTPLR